MRCRTLSSSVPCYSIFGLTRPKGQRKFQKFSYAPESLEGHDICVDGRVKSYKGTAEIIIQDLSQISEQ